MDVSPVISLGVNILLYPSLWVKEQIFRQKLKSLRLVNTKQLGVITGDITGEIWPLALSLGMQRYSFYPKNQAATA